MEGIGCGKEEKKVGVRMTQVISLELDHGMAQLTTKGRQVTVEISQEDDKKGLYKGYLRGQHGRMELGTLMPEGGQLFLRRIVSIDTLEKRGVWPVLGVSTCLAYATPTVRRGNHPPVWQGERNPRGWVKEPSIRCCIERVQGVMIRKCNQGVLMAVPWQEGREFPVPPLFCLATTRVMGGRQYVMFAFDHEGQPNLPWQEE